MECSICLSNIEERAALQPCAHEFCKGCITEWFRSHTISCPLCRTFCFKIIYGEEKVQFDLYEWVFVQIMELVIKANLIAKFKYELICFRAKYHFLTIFGFDWQNSLDFVLEKIDYLKEDFDKVVNNQESSIEYTLRNVEDKERWKQCLFTNTRRKIVEFENENDKEKLLKICKEYYDKMYSELCVKFNLIFNKRL